MNQSAFVLPSTLNNTKSFLLFEIIEFSIDQSLNFFIKSIYFFVVIQNNQTYFRTTKFNSVIQITYKTNLFISLFPFSFFFRKKNNYFFNSIIMTQNRKHSQGDLIYHVQSSQDDDKQNKLGLNPNQKTQDIKKHEQQTQISQTRPMETYQTTQLIKVIPSARNFYNENQQNANHGLISFDEEKEYQQIKQDDVNQSEGDSPVKLKRSRRKKGNSPFKSKRNKSQFIIFQDYPQIKDQNQQSKKIEEQSKLFTLPSYLEIDDSERIFDIKRQIKSDSKSNQDYQKNNINSNNLQVSEDNSEQYEKDEEQFYENYHQTEQIQMFQSSLKLCHSEGEHPIKILRSLPKQIVVEATIQSLILGQIPKGLKISCIFKIDSKFFGMSTQYNLVLKQSNRVILSAKKQHFTFGLSKFIISSNQNYITKRKDNFSFIGRLQSNFTGTTYDLIQRNCLNYQQTDDSLKQYDQRSVLRINYIKNILGYEGASQLEVLKINKSKLSKKDISMHVDLNDIIERKQTSKLTKIQTTKPKYDKVKKKYSLDFGGKAKIPSAKNLLLHQFKQINKQVIREGYSKKSQNCLLIAKLSQTQYLVEITYPFSIYDAFGVCLSNNDSKLLVN